MWLFRKILSKDRFYKDGHFYYNMGKVVIILVILILLLGGFFVVVLGKEKK